MDFISNKAITIGVGLLVTIAIVSGVIFSITQVINIYSKVYNTDTSIRGKFDEFDKFDGGEFTSVDVYNTIKKYYDISKPKDNYYEPKTNIFGEPGSNGKSKIVIYENGHQLSYQEFYNNFNAADPNIKASYQAKKWQSSLTRYNDGTVEITFTTTTM